MACDRRLTTLRYGRDHYVSRLPRHTPRLSSLASVAHPSLPSSCRLSPFRYALRAGRWPTERYGDGTEEGACLSGATRVTLSSPIPPVSSEPSVTPRVLPSGLGSGGMESVTRDGGRPACLVSRRSSPGSFPRLSFTPVHFSSPGGLVPRAGKKGECWTFLDWRLNSENDSPVHGQPSFDSLLPFRSPSGSPPPTTHTRDPANRTSDERRGRAV